MVSHIPEECLGTGHRFHFTSTQSNHALVPGIIFSVPDAPSQCLRGTMCVTLQSYRLQEEHPSIHRYTTVLFLVCIFMNAVPNICGSLYA